MMSIMIENPDTRLVLVRERFLGIEYRQMLG